MGNIKINYDLAIGSINNKCNSLQLLVRLSIKRVPNQNYINQGICELLAND